MCVDHAVVGNPWMQESSPDSNLLPGLSRKGMVIGALAGPVLAPAAVAAGTTARRAKALWPGHQSW